jgi:FtsP/CotA-like multicopper oxidase with cupredoxin domain
MRRSRFLAAAGGGMLALALPSSARRALAGDVVDYTLTAAPLRMTPAPGVSFDALAYNGSVPGPVLRVQNGQRVRVKYANRSGVSTTVHWHGMILPNDMDGAAGVTQPTVQDGGTFLYEFAAGPPGTRWYHDHDMNMGLARGLFGMIVVEDPRDDRPDAEFALVFHDVPNMRSFDQALRGLSTSPMVDPFGSPELLGMRADDKMSDEVAYVAHCINGTSYPRTAPLQVRVGQRVRLRILNANLTQTRYLRLAGHRLRVTHADGNPLERPIEVDALRIGVGERYDAWFEVARPGAWLLQGLSSDPLAFEQAVVVHTDGMEQATPRGSPQSLDGVDWFTYEKAAGVTASFDRAAQLRKTFVLNGGDYGSSKWTIDGKTWPDTEKIFVNRGDRVLVSFTNKADMEHPMHLHGHTFEIVEIGGKALARPLAKDIALVPANGGTLTWRFDATSPPGRWLLHCHNDIHMADGMMTEVVYRK